MTQHALLDNVRHKDLRIRPGYGKDLGFEVNVTRAFPLEFTQLQMEYPIVLMRDRESGHFVPAVVLGLEEKENLYLSDEGWDARYVPLTIQRQPFLIGFQESIEGGVPQRTPVVHIDLDHPKVSREDGEPLFLEHGGEAPLLERVGSILKAIHEGNEAIATFSKLLTGLDLVESSTLEFVLDNGEKYTLAGLHIINEERLRELNGDALEALHRKGHLQHLFMMLASMPNFRKLVDRKNQRAQAGGG